MGLVKDKLLLLEEEGIIVYDFDLDCYVEAGDGVPVKFDIIEYNKKELSHSYGRGK